MSEAQDDSTVRSNIFKRLRMRRTSTDRNRSASRPSTLAVSEWNEPDPMPTPFRAQPDALGISNIGSDLAGSDIAVADGIEGLGKDAAQPSAASLAKMRHAEPLHPRSMSSDFGHQVKDEGGSPPTRAATKTEAPSIGDDDTDPLHMSIQGLNINDSAHDGQPSGFALVRSTRSDQAPHSWLLIHDEEPYSPRSSRQAHIVASYGDAFAAQNGAWQYILGQFESTIRLRELTQLKDPSELEPITDPGVFWSTSQQTIHFHINSGFACSRVWTQSVKLK